MIRTYHCPDCDGAGSHWNSPSGSANDPGLTSWDCARCEGSGVLELDPGRDDASDLRPWSPRKRPHRYAKPYSPESDLLLALAYCRRNGLRGRSAAYAATKRQAMNPVDLPGQHASAWVRGTIDPILARYVGSRA